MHFINPEETFDLVIHRVGNKAMDEGVHLSKTMAVYPQELTETLANFFLKNFKTEEYFSFYLEDEEEENRVYEIAKKIFADPTQLLTESTNLANHLYDNSFNPKIKGGELMTTFFYDAIVEGVTTRAIGLFKSENKEKLLKVIPTENAYDVKTEEGINLSKIEKGCIIFDSEEEDGYIVLCIDNGKGDEMRYWSDGFLNLVQRQDEFFETESSLNLCKTYVLEKLPEDFEVQKIDQVDILNKSVQFFKENEKMDWTEFKDKVLVDDSLKQSFDDYKTQYEEDYDVELGDNFEIKKNAIKKQARFFKSVIKLDKNFHIYVHGNRKMIEQGIDEEGKKYYKLYYETEN